VRGADDGRARTLGLLLDELPVRQAVALAVKLSGGKRNELYKLGLELKRER